MKHRIEKKNQNVQYQGSKKRRGGFRSDSHRQAPQGLGGPHRTAGPMVFPKASAGGGGARTGPWGGSGPGWRRAVETFVTFTTAVKRREGPNSLESGGHFRGGKGEGYTVWVGGGS